MYISFDTAIPLLGLYAMPKCKISFLGKIIYVPSEFAV